MIVFYKNFLRNKMVNLSVKSIRYFIPDAKVICVSLYEHSIEEYRDQPPLQGVDVSYCGETKFKKDNPRPLDFDGQTSGYGHPLNASFFSEGFNIAVNLLKNVEDKVLLINEDHYFTTGVTLRLLQKTDFTVAYANWDSPHSVNASILCLKPNKVAHLFPISEVSQSAVEKHLFEHIVSKIPSEEQFVIPTRYCKDYFGDGHYLNSSDLINQDLIRAGIV